MTVYVDDARIGLGQRFYSHMIADTLDELHAFAARMEIRRRWYHGARGRHPHYDVDQDQRVRALASGAIAISQRQAAALGYRHAKTGEMGDPSTAIAYMAGRYETKGPGARPQPRGRAGKFRKRENTA